jgi:NAD(P)-dependent dehydrogenase (short-subunit alcohol dehydrogenase family)
MDIANRVVLITGGKRIGVAVARAVGARGADVALGYHRSRDEANEAAGAVRAGGRRALVCAADVRKPEDCAALVARTVETLGRLDVLVNMASRYVAKPFAELSTVDWGDSLAVDLTGSYLCARAAIPHMRASGEGRIINFADWTASSGRPRYREYLPYYVAKSGVIALTEALALELAGAGILVNAIAPGPILPPDDLDDRGRRAVTDATPAGRWGGENEVVKAVIALIETDFMTGETVRVDGGRHLL